MPQRKYLDLVATSYAMRRTAMVEIDESDLVPPWIRTKMPSPNMVSKMARELSKMTLKDYITRVIQLVHYWPALVQEIIYEQETKRLRDIRNCCGRTSRGCRKVKKELNLKAPKKAARETEKTRTRSRWSRSSTSNGGSCSTSSWACTFDFDAVVRCCCAEKTC